VTLVLSSGQAPVAVPGITNLPWNAAKQALDAAGLIYAANPSTRSSETTPAGDVLTVSPDVGALVAPDTQVKVVLSSGPAPVPVPDVSKQPFGDAMQTLTAAKFKVKRAPDEFSPTVAKGDVIRTDPAATNSAPYGSTVVVHVSKGPDLVPVPNVFNMTFSDASNYLAQLGFQTSTVGAFRPQDRVRRQTPVAGTKAPRGSTVTISH